MKKLFFVTAAFCFFAFEMKAQDKGKAPDAAKSSFQKMFPKAEKVKWDKEDNEYEASFTLNGTKMSAVFDVAGNWKETEETIAQKDVPAKALAYFTEHYKNSKIQECAKTIKSDKQVVYEIEIKGKDIVFDSNGNFVKEAKD